MSFPLGLGRFQKFKKNLSSSQGFNFLPDFFYCFLYTMYCPLRTRGCHKAGRRPYHVATPHPKLRFWVKNRIFLYEFRQEMEVLNLESKRNRRGVRTGRPSIFWTIIFLYIFWRARVCRPLLRLCRPFMIFEGCLDSNPECCRSKLARYRLSHPSPLLSNPSTKT